VVAGIQSVLVSLLAQKAEVKFDPAYLIPSQIANKIMELGYNATVMETETAGQNTIEISVSTLPALPLVPWQSMFLIIRSMSSSL